MRGQFYSVTAVLIAIPIILFVSFYMLSQTRGPNIYERIVSDQVHQLGRSLENDFEKALVTSCKRGLISAGDRVILNGTPLDDSVFRLKELMENGTLYGGEVILMFNNTLGNWTQRILSIPTNFQVKLEYSDLDVDAYDHRNIEVTANFNISVSDEMNIARIEKENVNYETLVSLDNMEDPIFPLKTNGVLTRIMRFSPFSYRAKKIVKGSLNSKGSCSGNVTFEKTECDSTKILVTQNTTGVNFGCYEGVVVEESVDLSGDTNCYVTGNGSSVSLVSTAMTETGYQRIYLDNETRSVWHLPIELELDKGYYFQGEGPNYLKRLEGSLEGSQNGMESLINAPELESVSIPIKENQVSLDYLYFSSQDYIGYEVRGLPDWFKINQTIANRYNLNELFEG
ncbi:MAG: hypothetical protein GTN38_00070 [Candidatus Aenigmarchaeota archaeon]|nr:hypothetical protein [Candidatus Aenigmarchaeota archaeon]NIP39900.1 hypothetical protein [Candidatus Aenigmarchaeota archaeon]NIQ17619.1 hypothetical protein [Candidatus Aenigmarchaeota archaeon]NIS72807.1 hypothetical protein [Candidatus Aenigmarchaeota archaeon]